MERMAVGGLTLHDCNVEELERAKQRALSPRDMADLLGASELVLISTCNRFEVAYARETGHRPGREDRALLRRGLGLGESDDDLLFHHTGRAAGRHLMRVAASLDSLVVGEDQILAQVKSAFEGAQMLGLVGGILRPLFESTVQLGKQVRTETGLTRHPVSVVSLAVQLLLPHAAPGAAVCIVGAGETSVLAARHLAAAGYAIRWVANRSLPNAEALAQEHGASALSLDALTAGEMLPDVIVSATSAPGFVVEADALARLAARTPSGAPLALVDLALPRDLEPPVSFRRITGNAEPTSSSRESNDMPAGPAGVSIDLEALRGLAAGNQAKREEAARLAESLIERKLDVLATRFGKGQASDLLQALFDETREAFALELSRLGSGRLARLSEEDRRDVERWARLAFGRLLHLPTRALNELARRASLTHSTDEANEHEDDDYPDDLHEKSA